VGAKQAASSWRLMVWDTLPRGSGLSFWAKAVAVAYQVVDADNWIDATLIQMSSSPHRLDVVCLVAIVR